MSCKHHNGGVHDFTQCMAYSIFASCGIERDIMIWTGINYFKL